jgi:serine protease Do
MTPIVAAVARVKESTVNIHTEKRSKASDTLFSAGKGAAINGMGTGVVVDERGYIATNHHVVDGVESLRVTLVDGASYDARVVSYDSVHDLAIIKIDPIRRLQVMPVGTSSDLLLGEDVLAIGNAFGYEHTVTKGIISALSRDVEVNEQQSYQNLIQIDAAINPGNSGGPLLNRDGEVIGINVAIRAGAQKIGFAIPIDDARRVIARLINIERLDNHLHGLQGQDVKHGPTRQLVVAGTTAGSPAADAGLQAGDIIVKSGTVDVIDMADFERSLLGRASGEVVPIIVRRGSSTQTQNLTVDSLRGQQTVAGRANVQQQSSTAVQGAPTPAPVVRGQTVDKPWSLLGLKLASLSPTEMRLVGPRYHGGMKVQEVRHESPAFRNGIREGDILVGLHVWETVNSDNIEFVVTHPQLHSFNPLKFYILRGNETLYGYLQVDGNSR